MLLALLAACGDPVEVRTGTVDGTDAVVGLVDRDGVGRLYLCGGPETMGTLDRWFDLTLDGDALAGEGDGWTISGDRDGGEIADPDGATWSFALAGAESPDGPYEAEDEVGACPAGAVVRGGELQGIACPVLAPAQVVPVGAIAADGTRVEADADPPLSFLVVLASP